jgi:hypothetical protein
VYVKISGAETIANSPSALEHPLMTQMFAPHMELVKVPTLVFAEMVTRDKNVISQYATLRQIQMHVPLTAHASHRINARVNQIIQEINANYSFVLERINQTLKCAQEEEHVPHPILVFAIADSSEKHVMKL